MDQSDSSCSFSKLNKQIEVIEISMARILFDTIFSFILLLQEWFYHMVKWCINHPSGTCSIMQRNKIIAILSKWPHVQWKVRIQSAKISYLKYFTRYFARYVLLPLRNNSMITSRLICFLRPYFLASVTFLTENLQRDVIICQIPLLHGENWL